MNFRFENSKSSHGYTHIIGCDEVGRGCLAGPVVAAAVILPVTADGKFQVKSYQVIKSAGIRDSKLLSPEKREKLSAIIKDNCLAWGIGIVDEKIIDKINIHRATLAAMKLAVENLLCHCEESGLQLTTKQSYPGERLLRSDALPRNDKYLLAIDGKFIIPGLNMEQEAIVDGDNKILSIAAASIVAKVYRDDLMRKLHWQYPLYNFRQHKGYGTLFHRTTILKSGLSPVHRKSFCKNLSGVHSPPLIHKRGLGGDIIIRTEYPLPASP